MNTTLIIAIVIIFILLFVVYRLSQLEKKSNVSPELIEWLKELGQRVDFSTQTVDEKLSRNMDIFNKRLDRTAEVMTQVYRSIGEFSEIGRSMKELQEFLQSPKLRGNIGEQVLKELLTQCLPQESFSLQYSFSTGDKVDAIVKTSQGFIPIDSKFPLENFRKLLAAEDEASREAIRKDFQRDVKKHIQDIAKKYILVTEGTIDYALMYVPSEAVYYEMINDADLYDFASEKRVIPVSPMSFYAYLKAILVSFEGQRIQSQAKEILAVLQALKKDYEKSDEALSVLNKHITNAYNQVSQVSKNFGILGQRINSTHTLSTPTLQEKLIE